MDHRVSNVLVEMAFGSHLYGTAGPDSDRDYKGVFAPSPESILLGTVPKSIRRDRKVSEGDKNAAGDVDRELYSLSYFVKLACEGQTVALDMLHANPEHWTVDPHPAWLDLVEKRAMFYTRNLKAFVGYARRQAAKYGLKGSRLADAEDVLRTLQRAQANFGEAARTEKAWDFLPNLENAHHIEGTGPSGELQYQVCGITLQDTAPLYISIRPIENFVRKFGARAEAAKRNEGVDFKALSHAFRAAYEIQHILEDGDFSFPLPETDFIVGVKRGELPAVECMHRLDDLIEELEGKAADSDLPEKVDTGYWDRWLLEWLPKTTGLFPAVWRSQLNQEGGEGQ